MPSNFELQATTRAFVDYLQALQASWPEVTMEELVQRAGGPERVCILAVDVLKGFCDEGALASARVRRMVPHTRRILERAHGLGVTSFVHCCDAHPEDSREFESFPPHCLAGTREAEPVAELEALPFANLIEVIPKRSINALYGTDLEARLSGRGLSTLVCLGDCTDLCLYQLAVGLRLLANTHHHDWQVVVPARAVETYDLGVEAAAKLQAMPHPGELLHPLFLYHMQLNGVRVVADLQ